MKSSRRALFGLRLTGCIGKGKAPVVQTMGWTLDGVGIRRDRYEAVFLFLAMSAIGT